MNPLELQAALGERWPGRIRWTPSKPHCQIESDAVVLVELCAWLFNDCGCAFGGMVVEELTAAWEIRYLFYDARTWIHVLVRQSLENKRFPSISERVHAADWHEREAEDLFGLVFEGHPRLGDFVLHDEAWEEGVEPMRHAFDAYAAVTERAPAREWRPRRIVQAPGAFLMPIGPVFSDGAESVHFLLESVGEDVIHCVPRLFYKYRGIEKIAEGRAVEHALLLAERFSATTAFAHALGYCHAVETICGVGVPPRARLLRIFLAELERFRHHAGAIEGICHSTALAVADAQVGILEEDLLRISCALSGHRWLFGLAVPGGMALDLDTAACREALRLSQQVLQRLTELETMLRYSSSFLDRLEEVGVISRRDAETHGLTGPIARASGVPRDLRSIQPYGGYADLQFSVPAEREGDGYARLRVLFAEAVQSVRLMEQIVTRLPDGPVQTKIAARGGAALGWVEAPRGAALHWVRLNDDGRIARWHVLPPSFANWHGFHLSVEKFAFQDFPIMLASMDLSVAENDR